MQHETTLSRGAVTLRPLVVADARAFRALVDEASWAGMSSPMPRTDEQMADLLSGQTSAAGALHFAVELEGRFVGRTSLYDLVDGLRVEIGNTYYAAEVRGTVVNPTAKLLLFEHCFDVLGLQRVALRCDARNTRSHQAILRLGARFEGTLRQFRYAADGSVADMDYFSVVAGEWPRVKAGLEARLAV